MFVFITRFVSLQDNVDDQTITHSDHIRFQSTFDSKPRSWCSLESSCGIMLIHISQKKEIEKWKTLQNLRKSSTKLRKESQQWQYGHNFFFEFEGDSKDNSQNKHSHPFPNSHVPLLRRIASLIKTISGLAIVGIFQYGCLWNGNYF